MLRDPHLTDGIGVKIAHNIHCKSTKGALSDRDMTSVTSARQKKAKKCAQYKELNRILYESQLSHLQIPFSSFA
jgi:hypothetical protein